MAQTPTPTNSKDILLQLFRDNNTKFITASSMRKLVEAVYNEMLLLENVIDQADIFETDKVATINQTSEIKKTLETLQQQIKDFESNKAISKEIYSKDEIDTWFYSKSDIDNSFYNKNETFSKNAIIGLYYDKSQTDTKFDEIQRRIDNIIRKNNLSE
jgi:hypothetical protein